MITRDAVAVPTSASPASGGGTAQAEICCTLALDANERETLLAGLEVALALTRGQLREALGLAWQSYARAQLAERLDRLADVVFSAGRRRSGYAGNTR